MSRNWQQRPLELAQATALAEELRQPLWLACLLCQRGLAPEKKLETQCLPAIFTRKQQG